VAAFTGGGGGGGAEPSFETGRLARGYMIGRTATTTYTRN
jgi:hypothetical protein